MVGLVGPPNWETRMKRLCFSAQTLVGVPLLALLAVLHMAVALPPTRAQGKGAQGKGKGTGAKQATLSERGKLAIQIQRTIEELQAVRAKQRREADDHQRKSSQIKARIDQLKGEAERPQVTVKNEREVIGQLKQKIAADQTQLKAAKNWIQQAVTLAKPIAEKVLLRARRSPGERKRLSRFEEVVKQLGEKRTEVQLAGLRGFLQAVGEEWAPARAISVSNGRVRLEGGRRSEHAWIVGLGLLTRAFVSEDGKTVGITSNNPKRPWRLFLPEEATNQIRYLVDVVRDREPPSLTPFPVLIGRPDKGEKK